MNIPEPKLQHLIEKLANSHVSFAIYRLPWTDEPIMILQETGETETFTDLQSLNGKTGFVLSPFRYAESHPIVLIRPDKTARGWNEIEDALAGIDETSLDECTTQAVSPKAETDGEQAYAEAFERFIAPLREGKFKKLVLSRSETLALADNFSPLTAFINACNSYPRMMISLSHTPVTGIWIGSTPEIILSGQDNLWHTVSLAGTMPMKGEDMPEDWSDKNREEQAFVSDYLRKTIKQFGSKISEKGPYTARAGQLVHLKTDFHFCLKKTDNFGDILNKLHPTPAVCGLPKEEAYTFIPENEGYDRSYYSGIIGWLDPQGHTTLYINLRCMHITGSYATLYAGGGILPSSEVTTEWEETKQKMDTMKRIIS